MITVALVLLVAGGACFLVRPSSGRRWPTGSSPSTASSSRSWPASCSTRSGPTATWFLDVAVVVAFVGFVGTAAGARFIERRGG